MRKTTLVRCASILLLGLVGLSIGGCSLPTAATDAAVAPAPSPSQERLAAPVVTAPNPNNRASGQEVVPNVAPTPSPDIQYPYGKFNGGSWGMPGNWGMPQGNQNMPGGGWRMHGDWGMGHQSRGMGMMGGNWGDCCGANEFSRELLPGDETAPAVAPGDVSFMNDIQPIFNERCVACHGGISGLFLSSYEEVMRGGVNGAVITPGDPVSSRLIQFVSSGYMPYGGLPLTYSQAQTLMNWVAIGAPNN